MFVNYVFLLSIDWLIDYSGLRLDWSSICSVVRLIDWMIDVGTLFSLVLSPFLTPQGMVVICSFYFVGDARTFDAATKWFLCSGRWWWRRWRRGFWPVCCGHQWARIGITQFPCIEITALAENVLSVVDFGVVMWLRPGSAVRVGGRLLLSVHFAAHFQEPQRHAEEETRRAQCIFGV